MEDKRKILYASAWTNVSNKVVEFRIVINYFKYKGGGEIWIVQFQYPDQHYSEVYQWNWYTLKLAQIYYNKLISQYKIEYPEEFKTLQLIPIKD